jgi:hypothetical protein
VRSKPLPRFKGVRVAKEHGTDAAAMAVQIHVLELPSIVADAGLKVTSSKQVECKRNKGQSAVDLSF